MNKKEECYYTIIRPFLKAFSFFTAFFIVFHIWYSVLFISLPLEEITKETESLARFFSLFLSIAIAFYVIKILYKVEKTIKESE